MVQLNHTIDNKVFSMTDTDGRTASEGSSERGQKDIGSTVRRIANAVATARFECQMHAPFRVD